MALISCNRDTKVVLQWSASLLELIQHRGEVRKQLVLLFEFLLLILFFFLRLFQFLVQLLSLFKSVFEQSDHLLVLVSRDGPILQFITDLLQPTEIRPTFSRLCNHLIQLRRPVLLTKVDLSLVMVALIHKALQS